LRVWLEDLPLLFDALGIELILDASEQEEDAMPIVVQNDMLFAIASQWAFAIPLALNCSLDEAPLPSTPYFAELTKAIRKLIVKPSRDPSKERIDLVLLAGATPPYCRAVEGHNTLEASIPGGRSVRWQISASKRNQGYAFSDLFQV
jgi:hypothetical protein